MQIRQFIKSNSRLYRLVDIIIGNRPLFNTVKKKIRGKGNIFRKSNDVIFDKCKIEIIGNNNVIEIGSSCRFKNVKFYIFGNNNHLKISDHVIFNRGGELWIEDYNCLIDIESRSTFEDVHIAVTEPNSIVHIGEDCMFANGIDIRTGDSHSLIDNNTGKRINYAKDVNIGNHVWVASHCSILKGVVLGDHSVVATRSVVTKSFQDQNTLIGGSPAKLIKENVNWNRLRIYE